VLHRCACWCLVCHLTGSDDSNQPGLEWQWPRPRKQPGSPARERDAALLFRLTLTSWAVGENSAPDSLLQCCANTPNAESCTDSVVRTCRIDAPHLKHCREFPRTTQQSSRNCLRASLNSVAVIRRGVRKCRLAFIFNG
jgi:hypothetical protein